MQYYTNNPNPMKGWNRIKNIISVIGLFMLGIGFIANCSDEGNHSTPTTITYQNTQPKVKTVQDVWKQEGYTSLPKTEKSKDETSYKLEEEYLRLVDKEDHLTKADRKRLAELESQIDYSKVSKLMDIEAQERVSNQVNANDAFASNHIDSWDGSCFELVRYVKSAMHDPSSFKHVKTVFAVNGNYARVNMTYRGKNAFSATVTEVVTAEIGLDGSIISVKAVN